MSLTLLLVSDSKSWCIVIGLHQLRAYISQYRFNAIKCCPDTIFTKYSLASKMAQSTHPQIRLAFQSCWASLGDRKSCKHTAIEPSWLWCHATCRSQQFRLISQQDLERNSSLPTGCLNYPVLQRKWPLESYEVKPCVLPCTMYSTFCQFIELVAIHLINANSFWMFLPFLIEYKDTAQPLQSPVTTKLLSLFALERHRMA
jgi:hypothetical protein